MKAMVRGVSALAEQDMRGGFSSTTGGLVMESMVCVVVLAYWHSLWIPLLVVHGFTKTWIHDTSVLET